MKICARHSEMCRAAVDNFGLNSLLSKSEEDARQRVQAFVSGCVTPSTFDPLISLSEHFFSEALRCGGNVLLLENQTGENDGHYCPVCEFEKHNEEFDAVAAITEVTHRMADWARSLHLIPMVQ